jgi:hypothetical protein
LHLPLRELLLCAAAKREILEILFAAPPYSQCVLA